MANLKEIKKYWEKFFFNEYHFTLETSENNPTNRAFLKNMEKYGGQLKETISDLSSPNPLKNLLIVKNSKQLVLTKEKKEELSNKKISLVKESFFGCCSYYKLILPPKFFKQFDYIMKKLKASKKSKIEKIKSLEAENEIFNLNLVHVKEIIVKFLKCKK